MNFTLVFQKPGRERSGRVLVKFSTLSREYGNPPTDDRLKEIWARGVQWGIGSIRYPGYTPHYFREYTGLIQDLVDPAGALGHDRVGGCTLLQIERIL